MKMMENPDFRVDYGSIVSLHLTRPTWDKPVVVISSCRNAAYYSPDVMSEQAIKLGEATRRAIEKSGKKAVILASNSLSHRHFTTEADLPEDMSREHIYNHHQYLWDMRMIELIRRGNTQQILDIMPDFTVQAVSETDAGAFTWLLSALGRPQLPGELYAYGTVIGTGNAVVGWYPTQEAP